MARHTKTARRQAFQRHCIGTLPLDVGAFSYFIIAQRRSAYESAAWADAHRIFDLMRDLTVPVSL